MGSSMKKRLSRRFMGETPAAAAAASAGAALLPLSGEHFKSVYTRVEEPFKWDYNAIQHSQYNTTYIIIEQEVLVVNILQINVIYLLILR